MGMTSTAYLIRRRKKLSDAVIWVHLPLLLILIGGGVTRFMAREGNISLSTQSPAASAFTLTDGNTAELPFSVTLLECDVVYYPATTTASDYSVVLAFSNRKEPVTVSINNVADVAGYRFFLTDISDSSCTLRVSNDPWGTAISYAGYIMFILAGLWYLLGRHGYRAFIRRPLTAAMLALVSLASSAADTTPMPKTLQRPLAADFGRMRVLYQGRVCPVSTLANDFCVAVTGSSSYRGLTAEQVLTGWIFFYDSWKNEPMIKIKGAEARRMLSTDKSRVALTDFYSRGRFLPDSYGSIPPRDVADAAAKANLIGSVCTGRLLTIFPVVNPAGDFEWLSWADDMPSWLSDDDYIDIRTPISAFSALIAAGRNVAADEQLKEIMARQERILASKGIDDSSRLAVEQLYIRWGSPLWPMLVALAGMILIWLFPEHFRRIVFAIAMVVAFVMVLAILSARGYVGGYFPIAGGLETMLSMALFGFAAAVALTQRHFLGALASGLVGILASAVALMSGVGRVVGHLMPVLNSPLLSAHVLSVMIAYTLFAMMAAIGVVALLSRKHAAEATRLNRMLLFPAVLLMGAGIFIGAVWANQSWGRYWGWDAKETWALITFFVYAFPLHGLSFRRMQTCRGFNGYLFGAFFVVLMTYFGVNLFLSGLHSYA